MLFPSSYSSLLLLPFLPFSLCQRNMKKGTRFCVARIDVCVCMECVCVCKVNYIAIILIIWLLEKGRKRVLIVTFTVIDSLVFAKCIYFSMIFLHCCWTLTIDLFFDPLINLLLCFLFQSSVRLNTLQLIFYELSA